MNDTFRFLHVVFLHAYVNIVRVARVDKGEKSGAIVRASEKRIALAGGM